MKKTFTLTALLAVACGAMAQTGGGVAEAESFVAGGIRYSVTSAADRTVEVAKSEGDPYAGDIVVPQTVAHGGADYTVTAIGYRAFASSTVTSVELPATIGNICASAFQDCYQLAKMELPDGIETISDYAFAGCSNLEIDRLPASLTTLGYEAFEGCYCLADSLTLPDGLKEVPGYAFSYCGMESLDTGDGVTAIGTNAFNGCYSMASVTFGDRLESIDAWAFQGCSGLEKIELPPPAPTSGRRHSMAAPGLRR